MNSKWIRRLNAARGWILGAGAAAIGIAWLANRQSIAARRTTVLIAQVNSMRFRRSPLWGHLKTVGLSYYTRFSAKSANEAYNFRHGQTQSCI
jgi:hypothetical protein